MNFQNKTKPHDPEKKQNREDILKNFYALFGGIERFLDTFESKIFPIKTSGRSCLDSDHSNLKMLAPKQMHQRLPIALAQETAGNNSESLLNEVRQIVYYLYQSKEVTKKVYIYIIKSVKV